MLKLFLFLFVGETYSQCRRQRQSSRKNVTCSKLYISITVKSNWIPLFRYYGLITIHCALFTLDDPNCSGEHGTLVGKERHFKHNKQYTAYSVHCPLFLS